METGKYTIVSWQPRLNGGFRETRQLVDGYKTKYFGIRQDEGVWEITHLPSGYLLTTAGFEAKEDAHLFADAVERRLGDILASGVPSVLRDAADVYIPAKHIRELILVWNKRKGIICREDFEDML